MTPESLYKELGEMIEKTCGGTSRMFTEPITREQWQQLDRAWVALLAANRPAEERRGQHERTV